MKKLKSYRIDTLGIGKGKTKFSWNVASSAYLMGGISGSKKKIQTQRNRSSTQI